MASTRSPSPSPSRPLNPSPKSQEKSSVLRKSVIFPSNRCITSAIPQKNSSCKSASALPSPEAFFEHKENERDLNGSKTARTRSPAENPYKGIKSFMAPTISASSKIASASPRKKILSERNDVEEILAKSEMGFESEDISDRNGSRMIDFSGSRSHNQSTGSHHHSSVLVEGVKVEEIQAKSEMDFESENMSDRKRSRMMDFSGSRGHNQSTGSHHPSCCHSDADPSLLPYDPITNYLAPRPQFLYYKPKPMIEQNHGFTEDLYAGDGRRLEDSFSDTEGSDICSEYTEETEASPVNKGPEDEYVSTKLNTQEDLVPDETYVSEAKTRAETYKPRIYNRSFRKSMIIPFLLFSTIVFSCLPLADLPIFPPLIKYESFVGPDIQAFGVAEDLHPKYYIAFVSRDIQGLVSMVRQWLSDSVIVLSSSGYTDVAIFEEADGKEYPAGFEIVQVLEEQILVDLKQENNRSSIDENIKVGLPELNGGEMVQKGEEDYHPKYEEGLSSFIVQPKKIDIAIAKEEQKLEEQVLMGLRHENIHLINKDHVDSSTELVLASQMKNQKDDSGVFNVLSEVLQPSAFANTNLILPVLGLLAAVVLAIALVSLLMKQKHIHATSDKKRLNKKNRYVSGGNVSCRDFNNESPYQTPTRLAEVLGDSAPTEISSSMNNSFSVRHHHRKKIATHEVTPQSRESGASSASISYGSFTAFEKTSARKGEKDDEVIAPVRRSSRIRNQAISG